MAMAEDASVRLWSSAVAGDACGGVTVLRTKVSFGPDGYATDVSNASPLPVAIISGGSSGGLTDEELRAAAVPVSGDFYPATQPVSGTVSVSGSVAVTGTFWQATQPVSGTVTANINGTVPVSGTFWQATQPVSIAATVAVSGPLTDAQLRASAVPVSGTFYPATQPVSGTVTANAGTGTFAVSGPLTDTQLRAAAVPVSGTFYQATQPVSIAATVAVSGPLTDAQLRASAVSTKDQVQTARVTRNFILDAFTAAPATDTMQQVAQYYNGAAVAATASPAVVPAGKVLRLTGGRIETKSLATVGSVVMRVRCNASGTAVIGSPIVASAACGSRAGATTTAMTGGHDHAEFSFGDEGLEIPAGAGVGFSLAGYGPTGTLTLQGVTRFEVWGYEYTP